MARPVVWSSVGPCQACRLTVNALMQRGVDFEKRTAGPDDVARLQADGWRQFPVVITDNDQWSGFDLVRIEALANL